MLLVHNRTWNCGVRRPNRKHKTLGTETTITPPSIGTRSKRGRLDAWNQARARPAVRRTAALRLVVVNQVGSNHQHMVGAAGTAGKRCWKPRRRTSPPPRGTTKSRPVSASDAAPARPAQPRHRLPSSPRSNPREWRGLRSQSKRTALTGAVTLTVSAPARRRRDRESVGMRHC